MLHDAHAFSGFSVNNLDTAQKFYSDVLGVDAKLDEMGLHLTLGGGTEVFVYAKDDHVPASFTILNFVVDDIDASVAGLIEKGVSFEKYEGMPQDDNGIARGKAANMGPDIAWFKDPAGNILSVLCN